jgi:hypothetical protein
VTLGSTLGDELGERLGDDMIRLGVVSLGLEDGAALGSLLGIELQAPEGGLLGSLLGPARLSEELGEKLSHSYNWSTARRSRRTRRGSTTRLCNELGASLGAISPSGVGSKLGTELRLPVGDELAKHWVRS